MAMRPDDTAGVIAPPPLLYAATLAACVAAHWALIGATSGLGRTPRDGAGALLIAGGIALGIAATRRLRRAKTPVPPWEPTTAIVTSGVYAVTRNPIYVAMALLYLGLGLIADSAVALLALPPLLLVIRYGVIGREERYLAGLFGAEYAAYRRRVRRWL